MKSLDLQYESVLPARAAFLRKYGVEPSWTTLVQLTYDSDDYRRYITLTANEKGDGIVREATIVADALVVTEPGHALLLPLADCIGAVIHDPGKGILMLSHLGRHNLEQYGGTKCVEYLADRHDVNPRDLSVWLSPAAGAKNYPLHSFHDRGMHDVAVEQLQEAGILLKNIDVSPIDVTNDERYFSHSQFLAGNRQTDGRHAVVATLG